MADIPRIDLFIINIIRQHYIKAPYIQHPVIQAHLKITVNDVVDQCTKGYVLPTSFLLLDKLKIMQNHENVPELYHISRHEKNKKIYHPALNNQIANVTKYVYSRTISAKDAADVTRHSDVNYWWLRDADPDDVRKRTKRKTQNQVK